MTRFTVRQECCGKITYDVVSAGGSQDIQYASKFRLENWRSILDYIERHRWPEDPPAWDIIFELFPDDMMTLLKFQMLSSAVPAQCKDYSDVDKILGGATDASGQVLHHAGKEASPGVVPPYTERSGDDSLVPG